MTEEDLSDLFISEIMCMVEIYAEAHHTCGSYLYNEKTAKARQDLLQLLLEIV